MEIDTVSAQLRELASPSAESDPAHSRQTDPFPDSHRPKPKRKLIALLRSISSYLYLLDNVKPRWPSRESPANSCRFRFGSGVL